MNKLKNVLDELEAKDSIADYFRSIGLKANGRSCYSCPLATYLTNVTGLLVGVNSDEAFVYILNDLGHKIKDPESTVKLGRNTQDFAWEVYSSKAYPDLIEEQVDD